MNKNNSGKREKTRPKLSLVDIEKAVENIEGVAVHTPVLESDAINKMTGKKVFFKPENLQKSGSFKFRGGYNCLSQLSKDKQRQGVVAFSSGNHGKALAMAGQMLGVPVTLVLPNDAPVIKVQAAQDMGAEVILYDPEKESREQITKDIATKRNLTLVEPYDEPGMMAGGGTAVYELLKELPDIDAVIIPVGGGGLIAGCGTAAKALNPSIRVYGVEPEAGNDVYLSLKKGERVFLDEDPDTITEGIRNLFPGKLTFPIIQKVVDEILLVDDKEVVEALRSSFYELKLVIEAASATTIAAVKKLPAEVSRVGVLISGGNIEVERLHQLLAKQ